MTFDPRPAYERLADFLEDLILWGTYPVGHMLPPLRTIAEEYRVSLNTAQRSVDLLQRRGVVRTEPARGSVVMQQRAR